MKKGTPLIHVERGRHIAQSSRTAVKLNVMSQVQASYLMKFSQQAKLLGNGLVVIDFGSRIGNIRNSYQAGENWERDLFIESSSFAASPITCTAVVNAGGDALGILMVATPVGWVGLIVGGVAVAGVAAYSSIRVNSTFKENGGAWYDSIISSLGVK